MAHRADNHQSARLHALDAIRAIALLSGIVLHSALSYAPGIDPQLWPFKDGQQGIAMSLTIFLIHIFRMPVFFLLAGFFAHTLFHRYGTQEFLRNRAMRILLPLALGWVVCIVCIAGVVLWYLTKLNGGQTPKSIPPSLANVGLNFLHLWFLYTLCWLYVGVVLFRRAVYAIDQENLLTRLADRVVRYTASPFKSLLLAAPISMALSLQPAWVYWFGIPTPGYTLIPPAVPLLIYGYVFGLGWVLNRQRDLLERLGSSWLMRLLIGLGAALLCLMIAEPQVSVATVNDMQTKLIYAVLYAIAIVSLMFGFIGLGISFFSKPSPIVRYLSDSSYWVYIAHLPVVMALQAWLMFYDIRWAIKFVIVAVATCVVLLVMYRYWVRSSWVGLLLNGKRY